MSKPKETTIIDNSILDVEEEEETANEIIAELTTLLYSTYTGRTSDQENSTRLTAKLANLKKPTVLRHKADAFALIFDRLLRAAKQVDPTNSSNTPSKPPINKYRWSIIDTLCHTSAILQHVDVPASCDDQLVELADSLIWLVEPLLPNHLSSGCCATRDQSIAASSPEDITNIRRAACALLDLLLKQQVSRMQPRRLRVFSLVLNAAIHFENIVDLPSSSSSSSSSSSAVAASATSACNELLTRLRQYCLHMCSNGQLDNCDFGVIIERLLATCCFRSLVDHSSFLAVVMFSYSPLVFKASQTIRMAFVAKTVECSRWSRLQPSNGWLAAAATCNCCRSRKLFKLNFETPLLHLFNSLTSARLRRLLDILDDEPGAHERAVWRLAMRLIELAESDQQLGTLASELVDYVIVSQRDLPSMKSDRKRINRITVIVYSYFNDSTTTTTTTTKTTMATRRIFCKELTRLLHSGASSSSMPANCSAGRRALSHSYIVRALYGQVKSSASADLLAPRRIYLVDYIVKHALKVLASLPDHHHQQHNHQFCLDKLE